MRTERSRPVIRNPKLENGPADRNKQGKENPNYQNSKHELNGICLEFWDFGHLNLFRISTHSTTAQGRGEPGRTTIFGFRIFSVLGARYSDWVAASPRRVLLERRRVGNGLGRALWTGGQKKFIGACLGAALFRERRLPARNGYRCRACRRFCASGSLRCLRR